MRNPEQGRGWRGSRQRGLTLIELILVLGLLGIVFALAAPSLSRFFRGRELDSEARRFLSLTRYGQSRAVSEGVPMVLWINEEQRTYGLQTATGYVDVDTNALEFELAERLAFEVSEPLPAVTGGDWTRTASPGTVMSIGAVETQRGMATLPMIRFLPTGFIGESSPEAVGIREGEAAGTREGEEATIWIGQSGNRLHYEIRTQGPTGIRTEPLL